MLETLRPLAVLAKVVELGSFRAAARSLGLSHSVVSHHVAQLEAALGVQLVYRTTRRLSLTEPGERLYEAASAMLLAAETGLDAVARHADEPAGRLRITAPAALSGATLIEDVAAFSKLNPRVSLALNFSDVRRDLVAEGIDLAIRMGKLADSSLRSRKLTAIPNKLVVSADYAAARPRPSRPADLLGWDWLTMGSFHRLVRLSKRTGEVETVSTRSTVTADDATAVYRLCSAGLGLAMLPVFLVEGDLRSGRLVEVLPGWTLPALDVFAVWPASTRRGGLTARFVEFLVRRESERSPTSSRAASRPSHPR